MGVYTSWSISFSRRHNFLFSLLADHLIKHGWFALGEYSYLESAKSIACFNNNGAKQLPSGWVIPGQTTDISLSPLLWPVVKGRLAHRRVETAHLKAFWSTHILTRELRQQPRGSNDKRSEWKKETTESKYFSSLFNFIILYSFFYVTLHTLNMRVFHQRSPSPCYQACFSRWIAAQAVSAGHGGWGQASRAYRLWNG